MNLGLDSIGIDQCKHGSHRLDSLKGQGCFDSLLLAILFELFSDNKAEVACLLLCSKMPKNTYAKIRQKRKTNFLLIFLAP